MEEKMLKIGASRVNPEPNRDGENQKNRLKECCQSFEAIMMNNLLKDMRQNSLSTESADTGREVYEGMMNESVARMMSKSGELGLGETLYRQLLPLIQKDGREDS
jgi:Rod binding domain-containing protein